MAVLLGHAYPRRGEPKALVGSALPDIPPLASADVVTARG